MAGGQAMVGSERPRMGAAGLINMCVGFFGIQFGWGLQMANMSAIYNRLGADSGEIPILWLAAPVTGLIVQPIVGYYSDRTWGRLGRRRPYFLGGAIAATIGLILMPHSTALWMAAALLWMLDAAINVTMEPFRAFVGDLLPESQRKVGFALQSVFIGAGAVISSALPILLRWAGVSSEAAPGEIPQTVVWAFTIGAAVYLAAVLWTIATTREHPPENMEELRRRQASARNPLQAFVEIFEGIATMPRAMIALAPVQFLTWTGLFLMWLYFSVAMARRIFGAEPGVEAYERATELAGLCFSVYNGAAFLVAFGLLVVVQRISPRWIHAGSLIIGGVSLAAYGLPLLGVQMERWMLLAPMVGVGVAWASILSMPYALLAGALPREQMGFYMGVFNFFIVLPQILSAVAFGWLLKVALGGNELLAIVTAGGCLVLAGVLTVVLVRPSLTPSPAGPRGA